MDQFYPCDGVVNEQGEIEFATDWLGNQFTLGDTVMYCISAGRGQMMAVGKVQKMRYSDYNRRRWDRDTQSWIDIPEDKWVVEVQVLTEFTSGQWNNKSRTRPAWVNPMNITAIEGIESGIVNKLTKEKNEA